MRRNPYEAGGFAFPNGEMRDKAQREIGRASCRERV